MQASSPERDVFSPRNRQLNQGNSFSCHLNFGAVVLYLFMALSTFWRSLVTSNLPDTDF
jgi:hypothetical protein